MIKEIHETPRVIEDTLSEYVSDEIEMDVSFAAGISEILIIACGTSYHAGVVGKYVIEELTGISVRVEHASEFNYHPILSGRPLVIGITQSGETADTLEAMRKAKKFGARVVTITNVIGSTATRLADYTLYIRAGPEICVAATKSFIAQLIVLYIIALKLANLPRREVDDLLFELKSIPEKVQRILDAKEKIEEIVGKVAPLATDVHHLHIHRYGDHVELTLHIYLPSEMTLKDAHDIASTIEDAIRKEMNMETTVHVDPV